MRDALFFSKLRVLLCGWRWKQHRRASWLKARWRRLRRFTRRLSIDPLRSSRITHHSSQFVLEPLESRLLLAADLTGLVQSAALIDPAVPTNNASAVVQVQNVGNQRVNQSQVGLYASLDTTLDASDVLLGTANTGQVNAGQSKNVAVNLTIPNTLDPTAYRLLAKMDNANAIAENSETNNVAVGGTMNVAWKFGTVPGRSGSTTLTLKDADGTSVTFSLSGPGLGEVIRDGANWDVKVTGTTASSAVTILTNSAGNGRVTLNDIHVFGPLASLTAATTDLTGTLAIDGPVNIPGLLPGTITLGSIQGGTVAVPSVEALTILGSTTNAKFYIGTILGQDGQPGGTGANADTYGAGKIGLFTVSGAMSGTSVRIGINPVDGLYGNGNDQLIGGTGSSIGGIIIGGALSADTRFYAGSFPTQYLHGLTLKPTAGDFHFISNFSGPSLSAALQQDSGGSAIDQLTNNPAIIGSVTDPQGIATFVAGFGATPTFNVLADRQPDGSFTLTQARLEQINGGPLAEGPLTLTLRATDPAGNATQIALSFTLDTQVPVLTFDLAAASDTAPVGDQQTTNAIVTLVGQTEANALVELLGLGMQTTSDASGNFSFSNVALTLGANTFTARATDQAGNQRTEIRTITRVAVGNNAPVLTLIGDQIVNEGQPLTFTATATDADLPVQPLTFSLTNGAIGQVPVGASIDPTTGVFTWTPTEAQGPGTYTFDVVVSDGIATDFETIHVTVNEVNLAPTVAAVANQTRNEATTLTLTLSATDVDLPANTLTWSLPAAPAGATIDPTTGVFIWTPTEAQGPGLFTVTARATDNGSPSLFGETTFTVTVNEVNQAPTLASIPAQTVTAGQLLSFTAAGSDADLPVNTLTYSLEGTVPAGAMINATTGVFTWTPTVSQVGPQTVTVRVTDNGSPAMLAEQVVSITVAASNLAPVLGAIGNQTVNEGEPVTFTATATDADIPAQGLTFSLEGTVPPGAAIDPTTGLFTWTPTEAQGAGAYTFDVVVTDNGTPTLSDRETITITVNEINQAPVLAPIGNQTVAEGQALTFTATATDGDIPGNTLTFSLEGTIPAGASIDPNTGQFTWTPTNAQVGTHSLTIRVTDSGNLPAVDEETITITVTNVNQAPILNVIGNQTIDEGQPLTFTATATDADIPAQGLTFSLEGTVPTGATIDLTSGVFTWTPTEAQGPGTYTFDVVVNDGLLADSEAITVTVNEVNQAPTLNPIGNYTVNEGTELRFTLSASDPDLPGQALVFGASGLPTGATFNTATREFVWTPSESQGPGTYNVTFSVTDEFATATETMTITVNEVNVAPVLDPIGNKSVIEETELRFVIGGSDVDVPIQTLVYSATGLPAGATFDPATREFVWTPTDTQGPNTYDMTFSVTDGVVTISETITITVNEVNQAPVLTPIGNQTVSEGQLLSFTAEATDTDVTVQQLTFSLENGATGQVPPEASITVGGVFTWTPTEAQGPGTYTFDVVVTDNGSPTLSDRETITITVNEVNQGPVLTLIGNQIVNEGQPLTFTAGATDADLPVQPLSFSLANGTAGQVPVGASIDPTSGVFTWTPTEAQGPGTYTFDVVVTDNGTPALSDSETITVTVNEGNQTPTFTSSPTVSVQENQTQVMTVTASDADVPVQPLTYSLAAGADVAAFAITSGGALSFQAAPNYEAPTDANLDNVYEVTVQVSDGVGGIATQALEVTVTNVVENIPAISINDVTQAEGTSLAGFTAFNFTVTLSSPTTEIVTVEVATADVTATAGSGDYQAVPPTTLTFLPGETTKTVTVQVRQDDLVEGAEQFVVNLNAATNATIVDSLRTGLGLITNDDVRSLTIDDVTQAEGTSLAGFTAYTFTVTLSAPTIQSDVTVQVATADVTATAGSGDYQAVPLTTLTFAPGETTKTVTVQVRQDDLQEGTEQFVVQLSNATNATIAVGLHGGAGLGTITNDDINTLSIDDATVTEGDSGTSTANFTVTLSQQPTSNVTVQVATANGTAAAGSDYLAISPAQTLTFTPTGPLSQTVSVTVNGDMQLEADETFTVNLSNAVGAAIGTATGTGTILNDDFAPVLNLIGNQIVNEGQPLSFTASATDANAGQTLAYSLAGTVPLGASINPTTGVFTWTPTEAQGPGTHTFDVVVTDNGTPVLSDSETITVTVGEVNQAPTLAPISNQTATVDQTLTFTAVGTDTDLPSNALAYSLEGLFSAGATIDPATGVFTWTPTAAQVGGPHGFTVRVTDNGTPNLFAEQIVQVTVEPRPNQAPVLNPIGNQTIDEGQQLSFVANATDPDGPTTFLFSLENGLSGQVPDGAVIAGSTGQFTWTPSEAQGPGTYTFDVVVTDNGTPVLSDRETITVTVNEVSQAPSLQTIPNQTVTAGQLLTFTAVGIDPDIPANGLTYSLQGVVPAGATIDPTTGVFSWTPTNAQVGPQSVTVRVTDNDATFLFAQQNVSITVNAQPNQAPVLAPIGNQTVNEGQLVTFTATAMDTDVPVQALTFSLDGTVPPGAALDPTTGVFTWTPTEAQGPGTFTFDVMVSDGLLADSETITVTVNEVNQAPTLNSIGNQTVNEGQQLTINVNATDPDGPGLTTLIFSLENGAGGQVPDGAVIAGSTGQFTWTPSEAQGPGTYTFDVVVTDGLLADSETITVTVNEVNLAPSLQAIPNQSVTAGQLLTFTAVGVDPDIPANSLTYSLDLSLLPPGFGALNTPTIDPVSGVFNWTPAEGQVGTHQIAVRVTDNGTGALFADQPFLVTVAASNQAPVLNTLGNQTVTEGQLLTFTATATDADVPAQQLTFSLQGTPPSGASITAGGVFTWTPAAGQEGAHSVTVRVTDDGSPALFDEETFTITVGAELAASFQGLGDLPGGDFFSFARGVSADGSVVVGLSDSISGGEAFRWTSSGGMVGLGYLPNGGFFSDAYAASADGNVVVGSGTISAVSTEAFRWTSGGGMIGLGDLFGGAFHSEGRGVSADGSVVVGLSDSISGREAFRWTSGGGIVGLGDLPGGFFGSEATAVSADGNVVVGWGTSASGQEAFLWTATGGMVGLGDLPGGDFFSEATAVSADGSVVVGSSYTAIGSEAFLWTAATGMVGLGHLDGAPVYTRAYGVSADGQIVVGESSAEAFIWDAVQGMRSLRTLLDADLGLGQQLVGLGPIDSRAVSADGQVIVGLGLKQPGNLFEAWRAVLPAVLPVNNAPVLNPIGDQTVNEGATLTFTASATDSSPYQTLTYNLVGNVPVGATIHPTTGLFTWTPTEAQGPGTYTFDVIVRDNSSTPLSDSETITVTVNEVNVAPVLATISTQTVTVGQSVVFTAMATDVDVPANQLAFSLAGTVPTGAAIDATTGAFIWAAADIPGAGTYQVTVRVTDNGSPALFHEQVVTIVVNGAPVLDLIGDRSVDEGSQLTFTATASDPNVGQTQTFTLQGSVPSGASITTGGVFTWTPTEAQGPGTYQVTVRVSDNGTPVLFDEETISISVGEVNQAPVLTALGDQTVTEGQIVTFFASATDADVPLNQLTFSLEGTVPAGASIDPQTGQFAWITAAGQAGGYVLTVRVTDNGTPALFSEQTVNVTVLSNAASFQGLGDLPGGIFSSRPFGVSGNGAVVVGESDGASGPESFRWTVGGGIENVSTLVGVPVIAVRAASFDGSVIVGVSSTGSFRWSVAEGLQTIVGNVGANAVSSDGSVVVGKGQINIFTPGGAFVWTAATGAMHLDALSGYSDGEAFAVSADGNVVVGASYFGPSGEQEQAVRWVADGFGGFTVEALGDLPGGNFMSRASAVSADGTVIVGVSGSDLGSEVFRWTATEGMQRLGDGALEGAFGVSADGSVIVGGNQGNAFIWDANNGVRNLEGVLFELGVPGMDGWSGLSAEGISADGRTIVGQGTNPQGDQEAYRAVFPENLYAPVYSGPTSFSGQADSLINFRLNLSAPDVSDQDSATQQFQVRLIGNVPAGVTLDPFGFFSWTPTTSDIGVHQLTVRLYDDGVPSRFSEFQLEVTVTA